MIPIETVFIAMVFLFGIIGTLRGWAKELLVIFSVILARFVEYVMWTYVPVLSAAFQGLDPDLWLYVRLGIFTIIVAFGYATTVISATLHAKARKEKLQDTLLGFFLGLINGYFIAGTLWGFLSDIGYNVWGMVPPTTDLSQMIVAYLPLAWLSGPQLFIAVAAAFIFVIVVFV